MKYPRLYWEFMKQNAKVMLEYRADFIIGFLSTFVLQIGGIFFVWVVFANVGEIKGWSFYEVTFVYGLLTLAKSINHIFFDNLWVLGMIYIREGKFDTLLLRPISPLFHLIADRLQQDGFGNFVIGLILLFGSLGNLNVSFGFMDYILLVVFVISGGLIFAAINLITCTSSFWVVQSNIFMWSVFSLSDFALYPLSIYKKFISMIITWIIPYAFASFYPASLFLDKGYSIISWLSPIVAVVLCLIAKQVWNFGIRSYSSTGS